MWWLKLKHWWLTRHFKAPAQVGLTLVDLEGHSKEISLTAELAKTFVWVELNLIHDTAKWTEDHLFAFYDGVAVLYEHHLLDVSMMLMFLHPEMYMEEEIDAEPDPETEDASLEPEAGEDRAA